MKNQTRLQYPPAYFPNDLFLILRKSEFVKYKRKKILKNVKNYYQAFKFINIQTKHYFNRT